MIEFFQITGSASFAARIALEEAGAEYVAVDIHPRRRDEPASFGEVNPLKRVPALREGSVHVYETGAVLLWLADRFPASDLGPGRGRSGARRPLSLDPLARRHAAPGLVADHAVARDRPRGGGAGRDPRTRPRADGCARRVSRARAREGPVVPRRDVLGGRHVPLHAGRVGELHPGRLQPRRRAGARALPAGRRAAVGRADARAGRSRRAPHPLPPRAARRPARSDGPAALSSSHGDPAADGAPARAARTGRARARRRVSCASGVAAARFVSVGLREPPKAAYLAWLAGGARPARCALAIVVDPERRVRELVCDLDAGAIASEQVDPRRALADHARGLRGRRRGRARRRRLARGAAAARGGGRLARADRRARVRRLRARGRARPPCRARGRLPPEAAGRQRLRASDREPDRVRRRRRAACARARGDGRQADPARCRRRLRGGRGARCATTCGRSRSRSPTA